MKVMHKETGKEYKVVKIYLDRVTLELIKKGKKKEYLEINYNEFERHCKLINDKTMIRIPSEPRSSQKKWMKVKEASINNHNEATKKVQSIPKQCSTGSKGITLKDICEELKVDPSKARRVFRKEGIDKPGGTWTWYNESDIKKIKEILRKI